MLSEELLEEFYAEILNALITIDMELAALEENPKDRAQVNKLYAIFHKIKYDCNIIGAKRLQRVATAAEDLIEQVQMKQQSLDELPLELLHRASDAFIFIVRNLLRDGSEGGREFPSLIQLLAAEAANLRKI